MAKQIGFFTLFMSLLARICQMRSDLEISIPPRPSVFRSSFVNIAQVAKEATGVARLEDWAACQAKISSS